MLHQRMMYKFTEADVALPGGGCPEPERTAEPGSRAASRLQMAARVCGNTVVAGILLAGLLAAPFLLAQLLGLGG